jgi:hypothetical protein
MTELIILTFVLVVCQNCITGILEFFSAILRIDYSESISTRILCVGGSALKDIWKCPHHNVGHWTSNVGPAGFDIQCWFMVRACCGGVVVVFCT